MPKMAFQPSGFFDGFRRYLQQDRRNTLRFLAPSVSFEHWIQLEAAAWINENRTTVGLNAEDWDIIPEHKKCDISLANAIALPNVNIEFKMIHNNKDCRNQISDLGRDLGDEKPLPEGLSNANTSRFGVAVLVYLRYNPECADNHSIRGGKRNPWPPEQFLGFFRSECESPFCHLFTDIEQLVSLEGAIGIYPDSGSAIWLAMVQRPGNLKAKPT